MPIFLAIPVLVVDLVASDGGLVDYGSTGQWDWSEPTSGPVGDGPAWGTNPDGLYLHDTVDYLEVQLPDVSTLTQPTLTIEHWYAIEAGDSGTFQIDGGGGFTPIEPIGGYPEPAGIVGSSGGYTIDALDLNGLGGPARMRFAFTADATMADDGWFVQQVVLWDGDVVPPTLDPVVLPADTQELAAPYRIEIDIQDNAVLADARVYYSVDGGPELDVAMVPLGGDTWAADIPVQGPDTLIEWHAEADDGEQIGRYPTVGSENFRVFLAAPTDFAGPLGGRLVADSITLSWMPPISPHPVLGYTVAHEGNTSLVVVGTEVEVPLAPGDTQRFTVAAEYPAGLGDPSEVLQLDIEVPELIEVSPAGLFQGQQAYVTLTGASLYLLDGRSDLSLGPGIEILDLSVRDVNQLVAQVRIGEGASVGVRDVVVGGTHGDHTFLDRFEVRDGDEAPQIRQISPDTLDQGDEEQVSVVATDSFASHDVSVETDEDLVVTGAVVVDGKTASFGLAANTRSRLGTHTLVLDDGVNLWTVDVEVTEYVVPPQKSCASAPIVPGSAAWLLVAMGLVGWRRRTTPPAPPAPGATGR